MGEVHIWLSCGNWGDGTKGRPRLEDFEKVWLNAVLVTHSIERR